MAVIFYVIVSLLGWAFYGAIWRLYFSPLSKFPGPKLAALTQWYEFYYNIVLGGMFIWEIEKMHATYGPIVRINPWELHVNEPDFYDHLYAGSAKKRDKYPWFTAGGGSPHSISETNEHEQHRLRRGALNPFFSKASIRAIEPIITTQVNALSTLLHKHMTINTVLDLRVAYSSLTLDIISSYCFGASWGTLSNPSLAKEWKHTLDDIFEKANLIMHFPWLLRVVNMLPDSLAGPVIRHHRNTRKHVAGILQRNPESEKNTNTIFHELRDSALPQSEKTVERLADEGNILIGAGSETTAQVLSVLSYHLLANPAMLAKLRLELDSVMPTLATKVSWSQLEQLPYLTGVLNEGLRMASPAMTRLPRIAPNEAMRYGEWEIPKGIPVSMSYYFMHYDAAIFPDPMEFIPERWVRDSLEPTSFSFATESSDSGTIAEKEDGQRDRVRLQRYLVPFSKGSRNCVGQNLAWAELYVTVAGIFRRWEMELYETGRADVDLVRDCFVSQPAKGSKGVRVRVLGERM